MKDKKDIVAILLGCGIVVELYTCINLINDCHLERYEPEEFQEVMHNMVIEKENSDFTDQYLKMEENLDESFWVKNGDYIIQKDILNNLETLKYKEVDEREDDPYMKNSTQNIGGYYSITRNVITVLNDEYTYPNACHEYMHFLSDGGYITNDFDNLNETLTELLSRAYLCKNIKNNSAYVNNFYYTIPLIRVIGEEKIRETYFGADESKLIEEISKYTNRTDILIEEYNYLCNNFNEYKRSLFIEGRDSFLKEHQKHLKNYWSIIDEIYENKYNMEAQGDNSLNFYKYHTGMPDVVYEGMSNSCTYFSDYNPFCDDYMLIQSLYRDTKYTVDNNGITYDVEEDKEGNMIFNEIEKPKELIK